MNVDSGDRPRLGCRRHSYAGAIPSGRNRHFLPGVDFWALERLLGPDADVERAAPSGSARCCLDPGKWKLPFSADRPDYNPWRDPRRARQTEVLVSDAAHKFDPTMDQLSGAVNSDGSGRLHSGWALWRACPDRGESAAVPLRASWGPRFGGRPTLGLRFASGGEGWCRGRDLNPHGPCGPGVLKPQRMPISPPRQGLKRRATRHPMRLVARITRAREGKDQARAQRPEQSAGRLDL